MSFVYSPLFVGLFFTSPLWLIFLGTILRQNFFGCETRQGRLGIYFQFLACIVFFLIASLGYIGAEAWPGIIQGEMLIFWGILLLTGVISVFKIGIKTNYFEVWDVAGIFFKISFVAILVFLFSCVVFITAQTIYNTFIQIITQG